MLERISYRLLLSPAPRLGLKEEAATRRDERTAGTAASTFKMPENRRRGGRRAGDQAPLGRPIHPYSGAVGMQDAVVDSPALGGGHSRHVSAVGVNRYRAARRAQQEGALAMAWPDRLVSIKI